MNFEIIHPGTLHTEKYKISNLNSIEKFIDFLGDKKSTTFLFWQPLEFVGEPFHTLGIRHTNSTNRINQILQENNIIIYVLYGGCEKIYYDNLSQLFFNKIIFLYWSTHLLHYTKYHLENSYKKNIEDINIDKNFDKLFSCLNHHPRLHRAMIIDKLYKYNLFNNNIITWNLPLSSFENVYKFKYWQEKILTYDLKNKIDFDYNYEISKLFTNDFLNMGSLFNLNIETHYNYHFITEKTYKNFLIEQPFFTLGSVGLNKKIEELGFVLYDEIIDYSYDNIDSLEDRVEFFIENLVKLKNLNYQELFKKIEDKVKHNKNVAINIIRNDSHIPQIIRNLFFENSDKFKHIFNTELFSYPYVINVLND